MLVSLLSLDLGSPSPWGSINVFKWSTRARNKHKIFWCTLSMIFGRTEGNFGQKHGRFIQKMETSEKGRKTNDNSCLINEDKLRSLKVSNLFTQSHFGLPLCKALVSRIWYRIVSSWCQIKSIQKGAYMYNTLLCVFYRIASILY